jgi:hypothetical protein
MVDYAAMRGIELEEKIVKPIVGVARKWNNASAQSQHPICDAEETNFWVALSKLAARIAPVNPNSLRKLQAFNNRSVCSAIGMSALWAKMAVWFFLIITLLIHSYENTLGTIIQNAEDAKQNFAAVQSQVVDITLPQDNDGSSNAFAQSVETARVRYCAAARAWSIQVEIIQGLIPQGMASVPQVVLNWLGNMLPMTRPKSPAFWGITASDTDPSIFASRYPCGSNYVEVDPRNTRNRILSVSLGTDEAHEIMQWATVDRAFVAQFILPLLYGLLGAFASVVRAIGLAVQNAQFSSASGLIYTLKVPLGALVGATIGIVIDAQTLASVAGLTSLGLAFGFAYAVDVFFSFLDELMSRLSGRNS